MKKIIIHSSFKPSKCSFATNHDAVTVGAGVQGHDILSHLAKHNLTTVVGSNMVHITQVDNLLF